MNYKNDRTFSSVIRSLAACVTALSSSGMLFAGETFLLDGWRFRRGACDGAAAADFDDTAWARVRVPHDWAITGPFDREIDKQTVRVVQDGEKMAAEQTGRTGALPWLGEGWYRRPFSVPADAGHVELVFDGAMAEPRVSVDGRDVGGWAIGYNSFVLDITSAVRPGGTHLLAVHLQNVPESSRWYPGAGIYRPVRLVTGPASGLKTWGTFVRTTSLSADRARVTVTDALRAAPEKSVVRWSVRDPDGHVVAQVSAAAFNQEATGVLDVPAPRTWSPETPVLYTLVSELLTGASVADRRETRFGIRTVAVDADGFRLNGRTRKFNGVCLHHDLGPLGAAFNKSAFRRQVRLLKEMGCDSIRTSHNMPAPWQMDICDEMGMMVMAESFDMWKFPKCRNGYARFFEAWWARDIGNLVLNHRNHPSVVLWSIGNEVPEQSLPDGPVFTRQLQDLCHRLDPTRPVTQGLDRVDDAVRTGVLQQMDVVGLNYRLHRYLHAYTNAPHGFILGAETASTVSSRGVYKFPVVPKAGVLHPDGQCSGYDVEWCPWSNLPDDDWAVQDDNPWTIGEFVWTGFDYLGEPTPYKVYWPSRSAYFGIYDLAGLPKDRMWLYRSRWNTASPTLHLVPHWTWPGREGLVTPVYCYTSWPCAELFVNGKSQGRRTRDRASRLDRYRLRWNDVVYRPGELKVVAYDANGRIAGEQVVRTAGAPDHLEVILDRAALARTTSQDTPDLAFATVRIVDKDGNLCPDADTRLRFATTGAVSYAAACNGDATSLEIFSQPTMKAFHGQLVVVVEAGAATGKGTLRVSADEASVKGAEAVIDVR